MSPTFPPTKWVTAPIACRVPAPPSEGKTPTSSAPRPARTSSTWATRAARPRSAGPSSSAPPMISAPWRTNDRFISVCAGEIAVPRSLMTSSTREYDPGQRSWATVSTTKNWRVSSQSSAPSRSRFAVTPSWSQAGRTGPGEDDGVLRRGEPRRVAAGRHPDHLGRAEHRVRDQLRPRHRLGQAREPDGHRTVPGLAGEHAERVHAGVVAAAAPEQAGLAGRHEIEPVGGANAAGQFADLHLAGRLEHPAGDVVAGQACHGFQASQPAPARRADEHGDVPPDPLPEGHRAGERGFRRASLAIFLAGVAVFAMLYETQVLLPELAQSFGVSSAAWTRAVSGATAGLAVGLLVLGPLSDRRGRTGILHAGLAASAVLGVLLVVAPTWPLLLVLRVLQGFALAGLPAVGVAYLREELPASTSARAIGLFVSGNAIGGLTGRLLGGLLAELGGWGAAAGGVAGLGGAGAGGG